MELADLLTLATKLLVNKGCTAMVYKLNLLLGSDISTCVPCDCILLHTLCRFISFPSVNDSNIRTHLHPVSGMAIKRS